MSLLVRCEIWYAEYILQKIYIGHFELRLYKQNNHWRNSYSNYKIRCQRHGAFRRPHTHTHISHCTHVLCPHMTQWLHHHSVCSCNIYLRFLSLCSLLSLMSVLNFSSCLSLLPSQVLFINLVSHSHVHVLRIPNNIIFPIHQEKVMWRCSE